MLERKGLLWHWHDPKSEDIAPDVLQFLQDLPGPCVLTVPGADRSRCRVVTTLLHGNEPSGVKAVHRLLQQGIKPAVDMHYMLTSIAAAISEPCFTQRSLPGQRDMNRCFKPPFDTDAQGMLAQDILHVLASLAPEAILDLHNTSGSSPSFAVAIQENHLLVAMMQHFTPRLIITNLRLGALMEASTDAQPVVTIECGGARDAAADQVAWHGLLQFAERECVFTHDIPDQAIEIMRAPVRLELMAGASLAYADAVDTSVDITLPNHVESLNAALVPKGTLLGWASNDVYHLLQLKDEHGNHHHALHAYIVQDGDAWRAACDMRIFMATPVTAIARSDCLFYMIRKD